MEFPGASMVITELIYAGFLRPGHGRSIHIARPHCGLVFGDQGTREYHFDDGRHLTLEPNSLLFLPQGCNYTAEKVGSSSCYVITVSLATAQKPEPMLFHPKNAGVLLHAFQNAVTAYRAQKTGWFYFAMSEAYFILRTVCEEAASAYQPEQKKKLLQPATEKLEREFSDPQLRIEELARLCGISSAYFRRLFQALYGRTPMQYLLDQRLARACELLADGTVSVARAMEQSGFRDPSYFSRCFRKSTGFSPKEYRAVHLTGEQEAVSK